MSDLSGNANGFPAYGAQPSQPSQPGQPGQPPAWGPTSAPVPGAAPYQYGPGGMPPVVTPPKKKMSPRTIIGIVVLAVIVIAGISWVASGNVNAKDVKVGACFTASADETISTIKTVNCSKTHDSEVFWTQNVSADSYPSDDQWDSFAQQYCGPAFASYDGIDYNDSSLDINYYVPDSSSWDQGDRELVCFATDPNGGLTASIKGSNQ